MATAGGRERVKPVVECERVQKAELLELRLHGGRVRSAFPVERLDVLADLPVETRARLLAEAVVRYEGAHPVRQGEVFARRGREPRSHVAQYVDAGDVPGPERRRLCATDERSSQRIDLVDR